MYTEDTTEMISKRNYKIFLRRYRVKPSNKFANLLEGLLGHPAWVKPPVFLDHLSLFDREKQSYCLTAELYPAAWPSEEDFKKLDEWCRYYGLKYEEVKDIESWHNSGRCRILMLHKDPHENRYYA